MTATARAALLCAAATLLPAFHASAAKWEFLPSLTLDETYTDNLRLDIAGREQSEWVTTITPRFTLRGTGDRLRLEIDYRPQFVYWANEGKNKVFQQYTADSTVEFIKRTLFLDARFNESPQNISLVGPLSNNNTNLTDNRTSVRTSYISPVLRHDFGTQAKAEARFAYSKIETDSNASFVDSDATALDLNVSSSPAFKQLTWYAAYRSERINYEQAQVQNTETRRFSAGGRQLITPQLGLLANFGYEDNVYPTTGPEPKGVFWSAGPEWNPTPRTRVAATVGRRYLGSTRSFDFSHRSRLSTWILNYSEDITTTRSQFLIPTTVDTAAYLDTLFLYTITDPIARQNAVSAFIARNGLSANLDGPLNFFTNVPFLMKRLQGSFGLQGVRNTVLASLFRQTREALSPSQPGEGDFAQSERTRQTGASALWTTRISAQTSSSVNLYLARNELLDTGREDTQKLIRLGLAHQFLPRLSGSVMFRRLVNTSQGGAGYTENAVSAALLAKF